MTGPESGTLPDTQVRAMFDRIARVYDRMNSVMTAGMHHRWRERAVDLAQVGPGSRALDVATGTGDLALELARRGAEVTGMDFAPAMLEIAREKAPGLTFEEGDALALRYPDGSFDAVTVGFGARNFADLDRGLGEMTRVTRPGGRVVVLEITTPQKPPLSWFFRAWFDTVVPALGRLAGDPDAYTYLPSSVRRFPPGGAGRPDGRGRARGRALGAHGGRDHRDPRGEATVNTAQAQLGAVLSAGGPALARLLELTEGRLTQVAESHGAALGTHATGHAGGGRQAPAAGAGLPLRRGRATSGSWRRAPRSSCSTWPRWCTTTCSTRRSCGAGARPCSPRLAAARRHRDRRPAVLAGVRGAGGHRERGWVRALSTASSALARGELMQRADAWDERRHARALPRALPPQDREPVRGLLPARSAVRWAARPGRPLGSFGEQVGLAFQMLDDVLDVSGPRSAPASRAAPTCSTAP